MVSGCRPVASRSLQPTALAAYRRQRCWISLGQAKTNLDGHVSLKPGRTREECQLRSSFETVGVRWRKVRLIFRAKGTQPYHEAVFPLHCMRNARLPSWRFLFLAMASRPLFFPFFAFPWCQAGSRCQQDRAVCVGNPPRMPAVLL